MLCHVVVDYRDGMKPFTHTHLTNSVSVHQAHDTMSAKLKTEAKRDGLTVDRIVCYEAPALGQ